MTWSLRILLIAAAAMIPFMAACQAKSDAGMHTRAPRAKAMARPSERSVPAHVQTAEYLWSKTEITADPQAYAPYLTWAYPTYSRFGAVRSAGIKTVLYINPLMPHTHSDYEYRSLSADFAGSQARDCNGQPVTAYSGTGLLLDVRSPQARSAVDAAMRHYADRISQDNGGRSDVISLVFVDNANSFYGVSPMPCGFDQTGWTIAMDRALAGIRYPVVVNSLSVRPAQVAAKIAGVRGASVTGAMYEACFNDRQWIAEEKAQIETVAELRRLHKPAGAGFWCYLNGTAADAASALPQRMFAYASFLLTYDPDYSVFQESFTTPSTFKVMPETQFVPLGPLNAPADVDQLLAPGGAYVRQYRYCYYRSAFVGACEVVVNSGGNNVPVPNAGAYTRSMALSGEGVLDGGTVSFGTGVPTQLGPQSAAILLQ